MSTLATRLAQQIRNAYDVRDRAAMEHALQQIVLGDVMPAPIQVQHAGHGRSFYDDEKLMADMPQSEQARRALQAVLVRIREHPHIGWHMGPGSQTFDLVTEAYATHSGNPLAHVRQIYAPRPGNVPLEHRDPASPASASSAGASSTIHRR